MQPQHTPVHEPTVIEKTLNLLWSLCRAPDIVAALEQEHNQTLRLQLWLKDIYTSSTISADVISLVDDHSLAELLAKCITRALQQLQQSTQDGLSPAAALLGSICSRQKAVSATECLCVSVALAVRAYKYGTSDTPQECQERWRLACTRQVAAAGELVLLPCNAQQITKVWRR